MYFTNCDFGYIIRIKTTCKRFFNYNKSPYNQKICRSCAENFIEVQTFQVHRESKEVCLKPQNAQS